MVKSLVLGFFDGVHKAHRAVIKSALKSSDDVTLITFSSSPAEYFGHNAEYILSRKCSFERINNLGVNDIKELNFPDIAGNTAEAYLKYLIKTYSPDYIFTGFNHTFGLNKAGNPDFLRLNATTYNYNYVCVEPVTDGNEVISSTLIKNYLKEGCIEKANSLLDDNFIIEGTVVHGAKLGRTFGFPTANIKYPDKIIKIPYGAYCVNVELQGTIYRGIMNWGMKPTVHNVSEPVAEVHILGYDGDLYGQFLRFELIKFLRREMKFNNIDELKQQIKKDREECLKL